MTENEAKELLTERLKCLILKFGLAEDSCDNDCDNCKYLYSQGTVGEQKKALIIAIDSISEIEKIKADGFSEHLLNMGYTKGYNKAIDEFIENMSLEMSESIIWDMLATMNRNSSLSDTSDKIVDYVIDTSKKIAEQLKGSAE